VPSGAGSMIQRSQKNGKAVQAAFPPGFRNSSGQGLNGLVDFAYFRRSQPSSRTEGPQFAPRTRHSYIATLKHPPKISQT
jgi:hypothetical protein